MSAPLVIDAAGLVKQFGGLQVLRGIDLAVVPGRITGLVGPNAAGKSTLIKSILAWSGRMRVGCQCSAVR